MNGKAGYYSSVTVVSVIPELELNELLEADRNRILQTLKAETTKTLEKIRKSAAGIRRIRTIIREGKAAEEILKEAGKMRADVIITGSHERHGAQKFLLGSVSSRIVDHAECSVLVVK